MSYQILLDKDEYFVSTDAEGERQQWFALILEPAGGVDPSLPRCPPPEATPCERYFLAKMYLLSAFFHFLLVCFIFFLISLNIFHVCFLFVQTTFPLPNLPCHWPLL